MAQGMIAPAAPTAPAAPAADPNPVVSYQGMDGTPLGEDASNPVVSYGPGVAAPAPERNPFSEIGVGLARGALVDLPQLVGQAGQYFSPAGSGVGNFASGMVQSAQARGESPGLTLNPSAHGGFVNALAAGAEQLPSVAAPLVVGAGAAALAPEALAAGAVGLGAGALGGGALFGGQAGETTLEKAQAKGLSPDAARTAAGLNAAQTFATQVGLGLVGGKVLGIAGSALGKVVGNDAAPLATDILNSLTGQGSVLGAGLKAAGTGAVEGVGLGAVQSATSAAIENHYGVDDTDPLEAAKNSIIPMLGLSAVMTPFGLAGRALGARAAANRTAVLAHPNTDPALRSQLADQYAQAIETQGGNTPEAQEAARNFSKNAQQAIDNKQALPVSSALFDAGAVQPPGNAVTPNGIPQLPAPTPRLGTGQGFTDENGNYTPGDNRTLFPLPDGSQGTFDQAQDYLNGLPQDAQDAARAKIFGFDIPNRPDVAPSATPEAAQAVSDSVDALHGQVQDALTAAGVEPSQPMTRQEFGEANGISGQRAVQAYADYLNNPETQLSVMRENIAKYEALPPEANQPGSTSIPGGPARPALSLESSAPESAANPLGDQLSAAMRQKQIDAAYADVAAQKEAQTNAIATRTYGGMAADQAEAAFKAHEDALNDLHSQVNDTLRANGVEPTPVTSEDPGHVEQVMRENATKYETLLQNQQTEPEQVPPSLESSAPPERATSALADQLSAAMRQREIDQAYQSRDVTKDAQNDVTANRGRGAALADAAARGEVTGDTNAPKTAENITNDVADVNKAQSFDTKPQSMVPFTKRLDSLGLDKLPDHQAQIDALDTYLNDKSVKMSDGVRDRMSALLKSWKDDQPTKPSVTPEADVTKAPEAAPALTGTAPETALAPNMPVTADASATQPAQAAPLGENVTQSARSHAQDSADLVDAALASFNQRVRGGEQLTPLEQERMEDLQGFRKTLAEVTTGDNHNDTYTQGISEMAREAAAAPYKESYRRYVTANPEALDPGIMLDSLRTGRLADTLDTISRNGSTPEVKALAARLKGLVGETTLKYANPTEEGVAGEYLPGDVGHVNIFPGGESEQTILHESVHAAQQAAISRAEAMTTPRTQDEAKQKAALGEIEKIRQDVIKAVGPDAAYGLTNAHEFLAELNTNPEFQQVLKDAAAPGKQSLWTRAVNAVKNLLGMKGQDAANYLERAMAANEAFLAQPGPDRAGFPLPSNSAEDKLFRKSPKDAADVTDKNYTKMTGLVSKIKDANYNALNLQIYKASLGWKTVQFIADRLRAMPEMVQSGFAKAVDNFQAAHGAHREATKVIEDPVAAYADRTQKIINAAGDSDARRALSQLMTNISHEASRGEFDYKMNYADNVKAGRDIPPANKAHVDNIHRQFTQLQRTNPEAAKAIVDGELQSARTNTMKAATVLRNLIDVSGDATMAKHVDRLNFMDPTVRNATNSDKTKFADGMASQMHARLQQAFADARKLPEGSLLRDQINEMADLYNAQARNPYFSLGRQGEYFVKVAFRNMDEATQQKLQDAAMPHGKMVGNLMGGEDHAFFRVDSQDEANGLYDKLTKAGGDKIDPGKGAWGKLADRVDSAFGVSPALRSILASLHDSVENSGLSGEAATTMRDTITRELLSMLPETSSRNALMQRRGIPGYDADFLGNFARRAMGGVQDTGHMHSQPAFTAARKGMADAINQLNRTGSADGRVRAQMASDEINRRYANSQKPIDNTTVNLINSLGHTFYLAASPAYLIRTTAQPFHRALPILGARFGFTRGATEIGKATGVALKVMANTIKDGYSANGMRGILDANTSYKNLGLPANEQAFIQELHDRGVMNLGQARQLQSMAMGGTQRQQDLARMASMTAQYAEMTNRLAVGLAAFRLGERSNPEGDAAKTAHNTEFAIQSIDRAMDNFDPSNTARQISKNGFAGKVTPLLTAFMNYNLQTMQQIARTVHDGLFNQDPSAEGKQRASEARKEFAGLMATTAMISGAMGLPFANVFAGVYNTLTNDNNDPKDIRIDTQNAMDRMFGHTAGGIIAHGLPHAVGFDSSTFGLENLLPGSEFLSSRQLLKDRLGDQSQAMMGPALNAGVGILNAMDKISDGYYAKGIEEALPSGLKPYFKAAELATRGYTDSKENPVGVRMPTPDDPLGNKAGWGDIGLQAVGFRTAQAATRSEAQQYASARQDRLDYQRGLVNDQFYKAVTNQDPATLASAVGGLQRFNAGNPTQAITNVEQGITNKITGLALARYTGTGVTTNMRGLPSLAQNLLFAEDPDNRAMP